ncbi:MAG: DUF86 domain-containing protein [Muribaculaceae bacterium]|nr:DUF86 domain-containing protein [Muribaculaceae bacterium]
MRERARDKGRLEDIIHYSENVRQMVEGMQFDDFVNDMRTYFAVMKNIEIVGEAAFMLSKAFQNSHPETPWRIIQGMRHYLVHGYSTVIPETLFETAINGIPELRAQVESYLAETDWDEWESIVDEDYTHEP